MNQQENIELVPLITVQDPMNPLVQCLHKIQPTVILIWGKKCILHSLDSLLNKVTIRCYAIHVAAERNGSYVPNSHLSLCYV